MRCVIFCKIKMAGLTQLNTLSEKTMRKPLNTLARKKALLTKIVTKQARI